MENETEKWVQERIKEATPLGAKIAVKAEGSPLEALAKTHGVEVNASYYVNSVNVEPAEADGYWYAYIELRREYREIPPQDNSDQS